VNFISSAKLGDIIEIGCELGQFGTTSVTIACEVRNKDTKKTIIRIDKIVFVAVDENGNVISVAGSTGGSGTSGTAGSSGAAGATGTSGTRGTSGTSGTGFNTISQAAQARVLTANFTSPNSAIAQPNLMFDGNIFRVTGSAVISSTVDISGNTTVTSNGSAYTGRYNPRSFTTTSTTTLTPNINTEEICSLTAQATTLTIANPTGTAVNGQKLIIRLTDNGTARTITWGNAYRFSTALTAPSLTSGGSLTLYLGFMYNSTAAKWDCIAKADFY
jgi:hypothetical protein